jgi:hypothetical protein
MADPPYAERIALAHATDRLLTEIDIEDMDPEWTVVRAVCPDEAVMAGPETPTDDVGTYSPLVHLFPGPAGGPTLDPYSGNSSLRISLQDRTTVPIAITGPPEAFTIVWSNGWYAPSYVHRFLSPETRALPAEVTSAAQDESGNTLMALRGGRFYVARD